MLFFKIVLAVFLALSVSFAKGKSTNVLTKGNNLLTYEEEFDEVLVQKDAKSAKIKCSVRVDVEHRLAEVGKCDAERIAFFTKDDMWLGDITRDSSDDETVFNADFSYRDVYIGFDLKDAAYMKAMFKFESQPVNDSNLENVLCPKGFTGGFDDDGLGICYKPFQCAKGEYSLNEKLCAKLPSHAKRLEKEGFACTTGFVKIEVGDSSYCEKKAVCQVNDLFVESKNRCYALPDHAFWRDNASDSTGFDCDEGYKVNGAGVCLPLVTACNTNTVVSDDEFSCKSIPENSHKEDEHRWACNDGFGLKDGACILKVSCDTTQYNVDEYNCAPLPSNAHIQGFGWECNEGFFRHGTRCFTLPPNSHKYGEGWSCNTGFKHYSGGCKKPAVCKSNQYRVDDFTCKNYPEHAHSAQETPWKCDEGYVRADNNTCVEMQKCRDNEVLNTTLNRCERIPSHATKVSMTSWQCKKGLRAEYVDGKASCKWDRPDMYDDLSLEFTEKNNFGDEPFHYGFEIGFDWLLFGKKVGIGPAITLERVYQKKSSSLKFQSTRLDFAAVFAFCFGRNFAYLRPFYSKNIKSTAGGSSIDDYIPSGVGGVDFGVQLIHTFDFYFGFSANPFKYSSNTVNRIWYSGIRLIAF